MKGRLDHIHGLRGLAALAVVFQHAAIMVQNGGHAYFRPLLDLINLGRFGVALFFMISGVIIPFSFKGTRPIRNFLIARVFRLFPAYWLSIPLLALAGVAARGMHYDAVQILANTTMLQWFFGIPDVGFGYWTLRYEVLFYLLSALLFWRGPLDREHTSEISAALCLFVAAAPVLLGGYSTLTFFYIALFFLGIVLRRAMIDQCPVARRWAVWLVPIALAVAVLVSGVFVRVAENAFIPVVPLTMAMTLPIVVLVAVLHLRPVSPAWLMGLGTISYSLYLFQDISLLFLPFVVSPSQWPLGYVVLAIGGTVAVASLIWHVLEKPMIALGRRLTAADSRIQLA